MSGLDEYGSGGILQWYMQRLSEKIAGDKFKDKEKVLAERALDQMRSGDLMRRELIAKLKTIDQEIADEAERCLNLLLHGTYLCDAFVTSLKTSESAAFKKNTQSARNARLKDEALADEIRKREAAIVDALLTVSDSDWERSSNYTIAKSVERQAEDNFLALGGKKGPDRKTIERWIEKNIRAAQTS